MRCLLPLLPALFAPALSAAVLSSIDETWDLRVDLGIAVMDEDLVGNDYEFDTAFDLSVTAQNRLPFSGSQRGLYLVWGVGLGIPYQTAESDTSIIDEITWYGLSARYFLGLGWEFNDALRLQVVPFGGVGGGYMDASSAALGDADDMGAMAEIGAHIDLIYGTGSFELGVGIAPIWRKSNYDLQFDNPLIGDVAADMDQDYVEVHVMLGWEF